jgi:pyrimidine operon attenuation protein / uracil phosphoribosyltransferase
MTPDKEILLSQEDLTKTIIRMAHELIEKGGAIEELALIGIRSRGVHLARRLAKKIEELTGTVLPVGVIDVTPFRDDRRRDSISAVNAYEEIPVTVENKTAVLVDDVIFRGRTMRAAMDALEPMGQAKRVILAVLIDRGARELPIRAEIVGKNIAAADGQRINVLLHESDGIDQVVVTRWENSQH